MRVLQRFGSERLPGPPPEEWRRCLALRSVPGCFGKIAGQWPCGLGGLPQPLVPEDDGTAPCPVCEGPTEVVAVQTVMLSISFFGTVLLAHPGATPGYKTFSYVVGVDGVPAELPLTAVALCYAQRVVHGIKRAGWRVPWRDLAVTPSGGLLRLAHRE